MFAFFVGLVVFGTSEVRSRPQMTFLGSAAILADPKQKPYCSIPGSRIECYVRIAEARDLIGTPQLVLPRIAYRSLDITGSRTPERTAVEQP